MNGRSMADPVSQLLSLGNPSGLEDNHDYASLGIGPEHIPDLLRMALIWDKKWVEEAEAIAFFGPMHAWYALADLGDARAIEPLLEIMCRTDEIGDDWTLEIFPDLFAQFGPAAVPALGRAVTDKNGGLWARECASNSLVRVAESAP